MPFGETGAISESATGGGQDLSRRSALRALALARFPPASMAAKRRTPSAARIAADPDTCGLLVGVADPSLIDATGRAPLRR